MICLGKRKKKKKKKKQRLRKEKKRKGKKCTETREKRGLEKEEMAKKRLQVVLHIVAEWSAMRCRRVVVVAVAVGLVLVGMTVDPDMLVEVIRTRKALGARVIRAFKGLLEGMDRADVSLEMLRPLEHLAAVVVRARKHLLAGSCWVARHSASTRSGLLGLSSCCCRGRRSWCCWCCWGCTGAFAACRGRRRPCAGLAIIAAAAAAACRRHHGGGRCRQGSGIHHVAGWRQWVGVELLWKSVSLAACHRCHQPRREPVTRNMKRRCLQVRTIQFSCCTYTRAWRASALFIERVRLVLLLVKHIVLIVVRGRRRELLRIG